MHVKNDKSKNVSAVTTTVVLCCSDRRESRNQDACVVLVEEDERDCKQTLARKYCVFYSYYSLSLSLRQPLRGLYRFERAREEVREGEKEREKIL